MQEKALLNLFRVTLEKICIDFASVPPKVAFQWYKVLYSGHKGNVPFHETGPLPQAMNGCSCDPAAPGKSLLLVILHERVGRVKTEEVSISSRNAAEILCPFPALSYFPRFSGPVPEKSLQGTKVDPFGLPQEKGTNIPLSRPLELPLSAGCSTHSSEVVASV